MANLLRNLAVGTTLVAALSGCAKKPTPPVFDDPVYVQMQRIGKEKTACGVLSYQLDIGRCATYEKCTVFVEQDGFAVFGQNPDNGHMILATKDRKPVAAYHFDLNSMGPSEIIGLTISIASIRNSCDQQDMERGLFKYKVPNSLAEKEMLDDAYNAVASKLY